MRAKDTVTLEIGQLNEILFAQTATGSKEKSLQDEIKLLQKMVKTEGIVLKFFLNRARMI
jgi:hypothetical protein